MATHDCPNCGRPTAVEYLERHDSAFCSAITSPDCWEMSSGPVHCLVDVVTDETACGSDDGAGSSTDRASVTCEECLARM